MWSDNLLEATIVMRGFMMDKGAKYTKLGCRMDGMTLSIVGILIHDDNG